MQQAKKRKVENIKSTSAEATGFKVLKWKVKGAAREFFIKPHTEPTNSSDLSSLVKQKSRKPPGQTLLVINVPPYIHKGNLSFAFGKFGKIREIFLHQNPTASNPPRTEATITPLDNLFSPSKSDGQGQAVRGYKVAYIVFQDPKSIRDVMERVEEQQNNEALNEEEDSANQHLNLGHVTSGLSSWIRAHNSKIVKEADLEDNVKKFMEKFERAEMKRKMEEKMNEGVADDEGWVNVTRRGKKSGAIRTEKMEERLKAKKRRWEKKLLNFTPTQIKESRMKQLEDLKKKFDEDKQRIALLKQQRKFKPF